MFIYIKTVSLYEYCMIFFYILFTCMALLHLPLDPRTRIQIYTSYNFTYMFLHIYTRYHRYAITTGNVMSPPLVALCYYYCNSNW